MSVSACMMLALVIPLLGALLIALLGRWPNVRDGVSLVCAVALFGTILTVALSSAGDVAEGARPAMQLWAIIPGLSIAFEVEPLGMLFALVASCLWIATTCYSIGYMRAHREHHQTRFYVCFAVSMSATLGVAFADNLLTLFICYEALTLATYPLVTHHQTAESRRAGRLYLGFLLTTSIGLLLLAIIWTWQLAGTLEFKPGGILADKVGDQPVLVGILLALYVFGAGKAALMPLHRWLPAAMVAPTPVSALLHAVAVVKVGVFTIVKVCVYVFGLDLLNQTSMSTWLMYVAAAAIIVSAVVALTKDNLKARLAYSTVSQLSYIVLGALLANKWGVIGSGMHIATHAFGKITLFFCAGAIAVAAHKTKISEMAGIGRRMPVTMGAFFIGSLSIIGLPPLGGLWSKWYLVVGAANRADRIEQVILIAVLIIGSLLSLAYLMPIVIRGFFAAPPEGEPDDKAKVKIQEAPLWCLIPLCVTAAGCVALFFLPNALFRLLEPITQAGG